jgi:putative transposase
VLEKLNVQRGKPANIRCDNGPEFISHKLQEWCSDQRRQITIQFIEPGKPTQIAYIERKNGSMRRREVLNPYLFYRLLEVREQIEQWRIDYNTDRPHKSLGYSSPIKFAEENYKR